MKNFLQRLTGGANRATTTPANPRLTLAAFGKHPGWDDHIPGIGVETETLAQVKQTLYVGGIGGQIDAGAWDKLEFDKRLEGFEHTFLWLRGGHVLVGQFWSSTDRKGRAKYPMVLCLDGEGVTPEFLLTKATPELNRLRESCQAATAAEQVTSLCQGAQERLQALLADPARTSVAAFVSQAARRRFVEHPELGPERLGFLRVLHELDSVASKPAGGRGAPVDLRPRHLRVPLGSQSREEALLLWAGFLCAALPGATPLLLLARGRENWIDALLGEPAGGDFFCLQASVRALPMATQVPYELAPELKDTLATVEAKFLNAETPTTHVAKAATAPVASSPPSAASVGVSGATETGRGPKPAVLWVAGLVVLAALVDSGC